MKKKITYNKFFSLLLFAVLIFLSCSRTEPAIEYGFISLVYYQDKDKIRERFSFFIIANDDDGFENLDELYLFHDFEQLSWKMQSVDWMTFNQNETHWIGSRSLALEGDETLPRGQFRAVLVNKGGEKTKRNLIFDAPEESRFPFPTLEISGGVYTINSLYPQNRFICYDAAGTYLSTVELPALSGNVSSLNFPSGARSAALWAEDPMYWTSALTEAASLR